MPQIMTTLAAIRAHHPCAEGWRTFRNAHPEIGEEEAFPLSLVLYSNGVSDTLWCLRVVPEHSGLWRRYAVWCARQVQHLMNDPRSLAALDFAERHTAGLATDDELAAAWEVADAARAVAWDAARDAADAARAAADAVAWEAADAAAYAAARAAAWEAADDAWEAADDARSAQSDKLRAVLTAGTWE